MNNLIVYASKHGTTKCCSEYLFSKLQGETILVDLKRDKLPGLNSFDTIVVGGSIYAGQIQESVKNFSHNHIDLLLKKRLGLFMCHYMRGGQAIAEFEDAFPFDLRDKAIVKGLFGGEFKLRNMNFFEKLLIKRAVQDNKLLPEINYKAIDDFAALLNTFYKINL
jgi:menaquinone-dependent protoporphyrinogen oxidase